MKDNTATAYFKMTTTYLSKHKVKKLHMLMILSALLYIHVNRFTFTDLHIDR